MKFRDYEEFWPFYLTQHRKRATRRWHFVGTSFVFLFVIMAIVTRNAWWLLGAPIAAYALAWFSHFPSCKRRQNTCTRHASWPASKTITLFEMMFPEGLCWLSPQSSQTAGRMLRRLIGKC
ncbi:DUF962 domain-containing protein [Geobacillus sp. TFV-3]|uniref:DUF962 domain-containing protein n=1 Tax=Geobacillus sp. TFV-3 TaxID=1897059 RepID=UPI001F268864|nr:DUF962 domain-containing protein [Geobacillus sp. TFV-3]KAF0993802.1 hypothetical protein BJQ97_00427 [Geobacillus sp. TFV-3]